MIKNNKKIYNLVCSLGGNCSAAHNLLYRNKRYFSLPFDWLYIENEIPMYKLSECFKDDFKNFCLKENLSQLKEKNKEHSDKVQYFDKYTEYYFLNHFNKTIEEGGYEEVKEKLNRRIKRLYDYIKNSKSILFILAVKFEMKNIDCIYELQKTLNEKFPGKIFHFIVMMFECKNNEDIEYDNYQICVKKYKRPMNLYDYTHTNFEWAFLDDIEIKQKMSFKQILMKKDIKLFSLSLFNHVLKLTLERKK